MLPAAVTKSLQVRLLVSSLECPSDGEFEFPAFFKDMEWQAGSRYQIRPIDSIWIKGKYQAERCINNGHHNLKLDSRARPNAGVRSGQELDTLRLEHTFTVYEFTSQLIFLKNPCITDIEKRRHDNDVANERNSIFQVRDALCVAAHIHDVIKRAVNRVSGLRIHGCNVPHDRRDRADRAEIETANIEIAAQEEPFVERYCGI